MIPHVWDHLGWLYGLTSILASALHWWGPEGRNSTVCSYIYIYIYIHTHTHFKNIAIWIYTWIYKPFVFSSKRENKRCLYFIYFFKLQRFWKWVYTYIFMKQKWLFHTLIGGPSWVGGYTVLCCATTHSNRLVKAERLQSKYFKQKLSTLHSVSSTLPLCDCFKSCPRFVFDMVDVGQFCNRWFRYCVFSMTSMTGTVWSQLRFDG